MIRNFWRLSQQLPPLYMCSFKTTSASNLYSSSFSKVSQVFFNRKSIISNLSDSTASTPTAEEDISADRPRGMAIFEGAEDSYGGISVKLEQSMDPESFTQKLRASLVEWRLQGKKGIWIKLPLECANLVDPAVKEGFRYHHAEPEYLMVVTWISESPDTIPANASHRVGVGACVLNAKQEVLVVREMSGPHRSEDEEKWKLPTGVVDAGEDISDAAIREVKEETGVDAEFVEVLAFRQSHRSFFGKSDIFFLCMLRASTFEIQRQEQEILDAKWMPVREYANLPHNQRSSLFKKVADVCVKKAEGVYSGFSPISAATSTGKHAYLYGNTLFLDSN